MLSIAYELTIGLQQGQNEDARKGKLDNLVAMVLVEVVGKTGGLVSAHSTGR